MKKRFLNTISLRLLVVVLFMLAANMAFCQGNEPCTPGGDPDDQNPTPCPIDGGLSLLIAAGIGLGAKKVYNHRKLTILSER